MLRLPLNRVTPKMILGRTVTDKDGRILLTAGQALNERYLKRFQELKIANVYVTDQLGVENAAPLVSAETVTKATHALKQSFEQCSQLETPDLQPIKCEIDNIIDEITTNRHLSIGMAELKTHDDYTYQHSINVCALSIIIGLNNGYDRLQLQELGIGAIMHDIGKVNIPLEILNKPGSLSDEEFDMIKQHPLDGYKMIRHTSQIDPVSAKVTLQHHERVDGMGYPGKVPGEDIHEYGLIVAVADVFDALTSDRPYRPAFNNQEAMNIVEQGKGTQLAPQFVDLLSKHVNPYPNGTVVTLDTGDIAIVCQENIEEFSSPQVKLLFDWQHQVYEKEHFFDLTKYDHIRIADIYNPTKATEILSCYLSPETTACQV